MFLQQKSKKETKSHSFYTILKFKLQHYVMKEINEGKNGRNLVA